MAKVLMEIEDCIKCQFSTTHGNNWYCTKSDKKLDYFKTNQIAATFMNGEVLYKASSPVPDWCPIRVDNKPKVLEALTYDWNSEKDKHWQEINTQ